MVHKAREVNMKENIIYWAGSPESLREYMKTEDRIKEILLKRPATWVETVGDGIGGSHYDTHVDGDSLKELSSLIETERKDVLNEISELYPEWDGHKGGTENWCHSFRDHKIVLRPRCKHYPKVLAVLSQQSTEGLDK